MAMQTLTDASRKVQASALTRLFLEKTGNPWRYAKDEFSSSKQHP
jgi:hypothetical protein